MEFKMMEESYEPNYLTYEENKNGLWKVICNYRKISVYVLFFYLLTDKCFASNIPELATGVLPVELHSPEEQLKANIIGIAATIVLILLALEILFLVFRTIKNYIQKKNCDEEDKS